MTDHTPTPRVPIHIRLVFFLLLVAGIYYVVSDCVVATMLLFQSAPVDAEVIAVINNRINSYNMQIMAPDYPQETVIVYNTLFSTAYSAGDKVVLQWVPHKLWTVRLSGFLGHFVILFGAYVMLGFIILQSGFLSVIGNRYKDDLPEHARRLFR